MTDVRRLSIYLRERTRPTPRQAKRLRQKRNLAEKRDRGQR